MNERIKELAIEAIAYADSKVPANDRYNDIYHSIVRGKFAELIVRECLQIANDEATAQISAKGKVAADNIWFTIRNRFGVDE